LTKKHGKDGGKLKIRSMKESCIRRRSKRGRKKRVRVKEKMRERKGQKKTT